MSSLPNLSKLQSYGSPTTVDTAGPRNYGRKQFATAFMLSLIHI